MLHLIAQLPATIMQAHDGAQVFRFSEAVSRAGLIDLDVTIITQAAFFFLLLLVLPGLVFKPFLARFDQREARTEGARSEAKLLRKQADDEVSRYETAAAERRKSAMHERAETRDHARKEADQLVTKARTESLGRLDKIFADQRVIAQTARTELQGEAQRIAVSIADKLAQG
jgi:F-type H+-transporting ATPase subunit b